MSNRRYATNDDDPLSLALAPPPNETREQRIAREKREHEAVLRSRQIDAELKIAKAAMKKYQRAIKVLVLGQSMSGKSTTIKNFQMTYAYKSWTEERKSWRAVILLNLVRSVNLIVDALVGERTMDIPNLTDDREIEASKIPLTELHKGVVLRLGPLRQIERDLMSFLGAGSTEVDSLVRPSTPFQRPSIESDRNGVREFTLRSASGWKGVLNQVKNTQPGNDVHLQVALQVVANCKDDITWLWNNHITREVLEERQVRLEDKPGFFLNDVDRIASLKYQPSDEDIVRARLRTTGVQEYHFSLDRGTQGNIDWFMYDVAGIRTSRAAWIPYFKDMTALIFLASVAAFNERLEEDRRVNKLQDSLELYGAICSNRLLEKIDIILFMNKTDLLLKKLDSGIQLKKYLPDYAKGNDYASVSTFIRRLFKKQHFENSPQGRLFVSHFTSVVDTKATAQTLVAVKATILRKDISEAGLM